MVEKGCKVLAACRARCLCRGWKKHSILLGFWKQCEGMMEILWTSARSWIPRTVADLDSSRMIFLISLAWTATNGRKWPNSRDAGKKKWKPPTRKNIIILDLCKVIFYFLPWETSPLDSPLFGSQYFSKSLFPFASEEWVVNPVVYQLQGCFTLHVLFPAIHCQLNGDGC